MFRRLAYGFFAVLLASGVALVAWYQIDGQPRPEAARALTGSGFASREEADGSLIFTPKEPSGRGVLILHGALIKPLSYARTAAYFAARGYTVLVPAGRLRLSILAVDSAAAQLATLGVRDWFFIGHSMGGFAALQLLRDHPVEVRATALWAAAMPEDFSSLTVPTLFLWGDRDGLLPESRIAETRARLPAQAQWSTLEGGNHQDFALYTHQFFDQPGTLGWERQVERANEQTAAFFARYPAKE